MYPDFITFDYQSLQNLTAKQLGKVGLVSLNFKDYSVWNGKGGMTVEDLPKVMRLSKAKSFKKPFRFWAIPDGKLLGIFCACRWISSIQIIRKNVQIILKA
jgi:alkaline phosphatase